jgi:hypothetical protein
VADLLFEPGALSILAGAPDEDQARLLRQLVEPEAGSEPKRSRPQRLEPGKEPGLVDSAHGER